MRSLVPPSWQRRIARARLDALRLAGRGLRPRPGSRPEARPLHVLVHVHRFLPGLRGGAQLSLALALRELEERGHHVELIVDEPDGATAAEIGFSALTAPSAIATWQAYRRSDVVLTQLGGRARALRFAAASGRPVVHFVHTSSTDHHTDRPADLRVFAARWPTRSLAPGSPFRVLPPAVDPADYSVAPGDAVTLVNLTALKGAEVFYRLVERLPDRSFLGVRGGWGDQVVPDDLPANLEVVPVQSDIRVVLRRTRVLLVPSQEELLGRIGLEAACSGIPTVATPVPGIREGLGDAALYAEADDLDAWVAHLRSLDDPAFYADRAARARARAATYVEQRRQRFDDFEAALVDLACGRPVAAVADPE